MRAKRVLQRGEARLSSILLLLLVLAISWLLWSGLYKPLVMGLGAFSCVLSVYLAHRMGFFRHHQAMFKVLHRLPGYWWWLLKEIVTSSIDVAKLILSPSLPISPTVVVLDAATKTDVGHVILGNSITLSPGTVTLDVHEGKLLIHCLTIEGAKEIQKGEANRRAAALEKK
ncbi:MAG: Na+/H+ antiporter subunit E [Paraglaciecola sp.]|uniref:Na+/H+ antiporter subunit E n=1 Tax=Pseudomonadati TaxID=3379134 RepID=UPI00273E227D|nr:Na+/H+ antiporter subunit E [Paraglaciecola sp.]MDP5029942.1 Na+/H+ antiporter subunit E [Paraglaciecola sp.]MDP5130728.1 Na+/H+ antiporter subunit E [Paraglaciecola sp.]